MVMMVTMLLVLMLKKMLSMMMMMTTMNKTMNHDHGQDGDGNDGECEDCFYNDEKRRDFMFVRLRV